MNTSPARRSDADDVADSPPDPSFWKDYNHHLELPISFLSSVFIHVLMVAALVGLLLAASCTMMRDTKSVPIAMIDGGDDDGGFGSPGSAGGGENLAQNTTPQVSPQDLQQLPLPKPLPEIQKDLQKFDLDDPSATQPLPDATAAALGLLDESFQKKFLNMGQKAGPGAGNTGSDPSGKGIGGPGNDSTRSRSIRWVLQFATKNGRDYLAQLRSLNAVVLVPIPPGQKQMYIFRDLDNPRPGTFLTETEWNDLAGQIRFSDIKRESVVGVGQALGLDFTPDSFWAFFPKGVENELSRLEESYRGLRADQIAETKFKVTLRNGRYEFSVAEQRRK